MSKKYKPTRYLDEYPEKVVKISNKKGKSWIFIVLIIIFSAVFVASLLMILKETIADAKTDDVIKGVIALKSEVKPAPVPEPEPEVPIDPKEIYSIADFSPFEEVNSDTVGWFYLPCYTDSKGLPIDLPMLYSNDNSYYLSHNFYKEESVNGWLYIASECNGEDITKNRNTLIYAHARSYKMFGGLKNLNLDKAWQENKNNHYIKISTPYEDSVWEIFSWHETTVYDDYWQTAFSSDEEFLSFAQKVQGQDQLGCFSKFEFTAEDRVITLSTCKGLDENVRVAVHAKLIVSVPRNQNEGE